MNTKQICGLIVALCVAAVCCPGGFFGIEEWKSDQREIHRWDPDEHQLSGRIVGAKLWCRRYPFAPIRFRCAGYLALCSLEAAECAFAR